MLHLFLLFVAIDDVESGINYANTNKCDKQRESATKINIHIKKENETIKKERHYNQY